MTIIISPSNETQNSGNNLDEKPELKELTIPRQDPSAVDLHAMEEMIENSPETKNKQIYHDEGTSFGSPTSLAPLNPHHDQHVFSPEALSPYSPSRAFDFHDDSGIITSGTGAYDDASQFPQSEQSPPVQLQIPKRYNFLHHDDEIPQSPDTHSLQLSADMFGSQLNLVDHAENCEEMEISPASSSNPVDHAENGEEMEISPASNSNLVDHAENCEPIESSPASNSNPVPQITVESIYEEDNNDKLATNPKKQQEIPEKDEKTTSKKNQNPKKKKKKKITLDMKCRAFGSSIRYSLFKEYIRWRFFCLESPLRLRLRLIWEFFFFHIGKLWYAVFVCLRSVSSMFAAKYTKAIFISLMGLMVPFLTIFYFMGLSMLESITEKVLKLIFGIIDRKKDKSDENNPKYGFPKQTRAKLIDNEKLSFTALFAMTLTVSGGILMLIGGLAPKSKEKCVTFDEIFFRFWKGNILDSVSTFFTNIGKFFSCYFAFLWTGKLDFSTLSDNLSTNDVIGLFIALFSNVVYPFYMHGIKWLKGQKQPIPVQIFLGDGVVNFIEEEEEEENAKPKQEKSQESEKSGAVPKKSEPKMKEKKNSSLVRPIDNKKKFSEEFQKDVNKKKSRSPLMASADNLFVFQAFSIAVGSLVPSLLLQENWGLWLKLNWFVLFHTFIFFTLLFTKN